MNAPDKMAAWIEARRWWQVAAEDIKVAHACLALWEPSPGNAAFHCQQAAEKIMKGLLVAVGVRFRKTHDLNLLADMVGPLFPALTVELDRCRPFASWATDYRYPPEGDTALPSEGEIELAITCVEDLLARVAKLAVPNSQTAEPTA